MAFEIILTSERLARLAKEWERIAGEPLKIERVGDAIYAFGSELACLRLAYQYRYGVASTIAKYSVNRKSWFFRLETVR
jgi:hypothetical protein